VTEKHKTEGEYKARTASQPLLVQHLSELSRQESAPWNVVAQVLKRKSSTANHTRSPNI